MQKPRKYKKRKIGYIINAGSISFYDQGFSLTQNTQTFTDIPEYVSTDICDGDILKTKLSRPFTKDEFEYLMRDNYRLTERNVELMNENKRLKDKRWWRR